LELKIRVGTLPIRITGEEIDSQLKAFFLSFPETEEDPRISFIFSNSLDGKGGDKQPISLVGAEIHDHALRFTDYAAPVGYLVELSTDGTLKVNCNVNDTSRVTGLRQRLNMVPFFNSFYLGKGERSLNFIYSLWQYLLQSLLIETGASLIHASCVEKNGKVLMFPAWGGAGKTSMMYRLVMNGDWKFLSDDMSILSRDGVLYLNSAPIAVYPYNLKGLPHLHRRISELQSLGGRIHWHLWNRILGESRVGRRIFPRDLFGDKKVADRGILEKAIYLVRWNAATFHFDSICAEELASHAVNVLLAEIRQFRFEFQAWNSVPNFSLFRNIWEIAERTRLILAEAFKNKDLHVLYIPKQAVPNDIHAFVSRYIDS